MRRAARTTRRPRRPGCSGDDHRCVDGLSQPGQCADLSNPPASLQPGGDAECNDNLHGEPETSVVELFDFAGAPSLATPVTAAAPPLADCTPPG